MVTKAHWHLAEIADRAVADYVPGQSWYAVADKVMAWLKARLECYKYAGTDITMSCGSVSAIQAQINGLLKYKRNGISAHAVRETFYYNNEDFSSVDDFIAIVVRTAKYWCVGQHAVQFRAGLAYGLDIDLPSVEYTYGQSLGLRLATLQFVAGHEFTHNWWVGWPGGSWAEQTFYSGGLGTWEFLVGEEATAEVEKIVRQAEHEISNELAKIWQAELDDAFNQLKRHKEALEAANYAAEQARWPISRRELVLEGDAC